MLRRIRREDRGRVEQALGCVDLASQSRKLFATLSGGQRQRALIARALLVEPALMLLDEPTSGVDRTTRHLILELLGRLNREQGLAILVVTHDLASLREFAHHIMWVEDGEVTKCEVEDALHIWSAEGGQPLHRHEGS
jgi:ABC-type Mn2+/Zn2+ transport system ATPase subunit